MENKVERHVQEMNEYLDRARGVQRITDEIVISHWYGDQMEGLRRTNEPMKFQENELKLRCEELVEQSESRTPRV